MCNCDSDLNCVPKYKRQYNWVDKVFLTLVFTTVVLCLFGISICLYKML
jgi:hypothetical protein